MNHTKYSTLLLWALLLIFGNTRTAEPVPSALYDPAGRIGHFIFHTKNSTAAHAAIVACAGLAGAGLLAVGAGIAKLQQYLCEQRAKQYKELHEQKEKQLREGTVKYPDLRIHTMIPADPLRPDLYPQEAVILSIGGLGTPTSERDAYELACEIMEWKNTYQVPLIALIKGNCSAFAYQIALTADRIVFGPLARLSIEPFSQEPARHAKAQELLSKIYPLHHRERALKYAQLLDHEPKMLTAEEAVSAGLVDQIGTKDDAAKLIRTILRDTRPITWCND